MIMLYPLMTLPDGTEIVHSESMVKDNRETVKVVVERPVDYGFQSLAHVIYELAGDRGFEHAAVI